MADSRWKVFDRAMRILRRRDTDLQLVERWWLHDFDANEQHRVIVAASRTKFERPARGDPTDDGGVVSATFLVTDRRLTERLARRFGFVAEAMLEPNSLGQAASFADDVQFQRVAARDEQRLVGSLNHWRQVGPDEAQVKLTRPRHVGERKHQPLDRRGRLQRMQHDHRGDNRHQNRTGNRHALDDLRFDNVTRFDLLQIVQGLADDGALKFGRSRFLIELMLQELDRAEDSSLKSGKAAFDARREKRRSQWLHERQDQLSPQHRPGTGQQSEANHQPQARVVEVD